MLKFLFRFFFARVLDNAIHKLQTSRYTWEKFRRASSSTAASWQVSGQAEQYKERTGMFSSCLQDGLHWVSGHLVTKPSRHQEICILLTRGARKPNLQGVITHASIPLRMNGMHMKQFDHARLDLLLLVIWSRVFLTVCHVKRTQSTAFAQKRFDLRSLSPSLRNLWLLLVLIKQQNLFPLILLWNLRAGEEGKYP